MPPSAVSLLSFSLPPATLSFLASPSFPPGPSTQRAPGKCFLVERAGPGWFSSVGLRGVSISLHEQVPLCYYIFPQAECLLRLPDPLLF